MRKRDGENKMTKINKNEKEVQSQAVYTITVNSYLTPEEIKTNFDPLLLDNITTVFHSITGASTEVTIEEIELTAVEWVDEDKKGNY